MQRPNFIFILADDLGYADLGCFGSTATFSKPPFALSPNLDRLARQGLLSTQGYSNSPVCSPTRFALMTGNYQYRYRGALDEPIASARGSSVLGLPQSVPTLPKMLREAGYATGLVGKWHLGFPPHFGPLQSGYDYFYGATAGAVDYFSHKDSRGHHDLWENNTEVFDEGYFTDLVSDRAVQWLGQFGPASDKPFMLSLHYTAPHWPWLTRDDINESQRLEKTNAIAHLDGGNLQTYWRMIQQLDEGIGRVIHQLEINGQLDNTLIIFTSDNGGERFSNNWPFTGGKMDLLEGGIRVPTIAHWPRLIKPGSTTHCVHLTMDWSATILDAAHILEIARSQGCATDSESLMPILKNTASDQERIMQLSNRALYWRMNHRQQAALREGPYKYLAIEGHEYLFNIEQDAREKANLAKREPVRLQTMRDQWQAWATTMPGIPADAKVSLVYGPADIPKGT
jgi:arylsulfatase A-like enzyme